MLLVRERRNFWVFIVFLLRGLVICGVAGGFRLCGYPGGRYQGHGVGMLGAIVAVLVLGYMKGAETRWRAASVSSAAPPLVRCRVTEDASLNAKGSKPLSGAAHVEVSRSKRIDVSPAPHPAARKRLLLRGRGWLEGDLTAGPLLLPGNPGTFAASPDRGSLHSDPRPGRRSRRLHGGLLCHLAVRESRSLDWSVAGSIAHFAPKRGLSGPMAER